MTRSDRILTLSKALRMIEASIAKADTISVACSVAIVDHTGNLLNFVRQDSAFSGSAELAINKAFTAQIFNKRTDELALLAQPGAQLFGIQHSHGGRVAVFGGGIPIRVDGHAIAAIGVSGGSVADDVAIAEAGADAWR
jgi:uncharacterized protein GlcG (DUF336 family)